ncbi:hypothetical protein A5652_17025 [Mycobacterium sp. 1165178.9]|nr:hypothetical protein A5652_17025 [Mycobacterium sp. 1165178.9]
MRQRIDWSMSAPVMIDLRIKRRKPRSAPDFRPHPPAPVAVRARGIRVIGYQRGGRGLRDRARARLTLAPAAMTRRPRASGHRRRTAAVAAKDAGYGRSR